MLIEGGNPSPSRELNRVFTPLVQAVERNMAASQWPDNADRVGPSVCTVESVVIPQGRSRVGNLIEKFPDIFDFSDQCVVVPFAISNPVVIRASVGQYGVGWARRIAAASGEIIKGMVDKERPSNILDLAEEAEANNGSLLDAYTQRRSSLEFVPADEFEARLNCLFSQGMDLPEFSGSIVTFAEGIQSVEFTANLFMDKKVPGYENDPERLFNALVDQHVFSRFSSVVPPALTGFLGRFDGVFKPPVIIPQADGELDINPVITTHFDAERDGEYKDYGTGATTPLDVRGCPLSRKINGNKYAGVDMAAQLVARVLSTQKVDFVTSLGHF